MDIETHGPYIYGTDRNPNSIPIWKLVLDDKESVKEVIIYVRSNDGWACGIKFVVADHNGNLTNRYFGYTYMQRATSNPIILQSGEYLTQIHGTHFIISDDEDSFPGKIFSIGFCTNLRRYEAYGGVSVDTLSRSKTAKFESPLLSVNQSIVEISSESSYDWGIFNIGVRIRKGPKVEEKSEEKMEEKSEENMEEIETHGPYGQDRDPDWKLVLDNKESVKEVIIYARSDLGMACGINFVVADHNGKLTNHWFGLLHNKKRPHRTTSNRIILQSGEYLTQIHGTHWINEKRSSGYIYSIGFCTNLRRYEAHGGVPSDRLHRIKTAKFESPLLSVNQSIVEIFSLSGADLIWGIGVGIRKGPKVEEKSEEKMEEKSEENMEEKSEENMEEKRGSLAFFATYRPPVPLDIYSANYPPMSARDEELMTDGKSYNYNGQVIPPTALKTILQRPLLRDLGTDHDVDSGSLSAMIFVSERTRNLETLHIAILFRDKEPKVQVFNFAQVYDTFKGVRMEDSGCIAGNYLVYVSTMEPASEPHQPWTAVYKTHLRTGKTERLTLQGQADMSPSVSPDGKRIAVATFQIKAAGWDGEIEDLRTSICVMDIEEPLNREFVVIDGGWPTWGSNDVLYFHRNVDKVKIEKRWGVFRVHLHEGPTSVTRVTPENISAMTPAAIDETRVAVATLRRRFTFNMQDERKENQYRHIEIFDTNKPKHESIEITRKTRPKADHFNPFVIKDNKGGIKRIGYHRCHSDKVNAYSTVEKDFYKLQSPDPEIGVFRVSGVFPSISECGKKLAFVDNEFKAVWVADDTGLHMVYEPEDKKPNSVFSPVWNRKKDILYVCVGPSFDAKKTVRIVAIIDVSTPNRKPMDLTHEGYNSAFPSTNPDGTKLVYRSTKENGHKNLYIMEKAELGEKAGLTRLTEGNWTDTHCQWSPRQDWIVFSSNRSYPTAKKLEDLPDGGHFGVYLVKVSDKNVVVKVIDSGYSRIGGMFAGHVNHPCFSPDGRSLVLTADLAGVSCDPVSMPLFVHSVRPYGDIFIIDIDPDDIYKNSNVKRFTRVTHSRYENATATWTMASTKDLHTKWKVNIAGNDVKMYSPKCPFVHQSEAESFHMTGHLLLQDKHCC